jgi:hypothetical protein
VVGLTTALKIQETGQFAVSILAETLPSDPKSIRYTSHWAVRPAFISAHLIFALTLPSRALTTLASPVATFASAVRHRPNLTAQWRNTDPATHRA